MAPILASLVGVRVLVCGSRTWNDLPTITSVLTSLRPSVVIHGGALGADSLGGMAAWIMKVPIERYPADWKTHGKAAGAIRNQEMLDKGKPQLVLAFWDGVSRGTKDMIDRAERAGVPVYVTQPKYRAPTQEVPYV